MTAPPGHPQTFADLLALPDDAPPVELIAGVFMEVPVRSWDHQGVLQRIAWLFFNAAQASDAGESRSARFSVVFSEHDVVEPDLVFIRNERLENLIVKGVVRGAPDIVVEVLSPFNWRHDLVTKKNLYARFGVPEYWVFDPTKRTITQHWLVAGAYEILDPAPEAVYRSRVLPELVIDPLFCFAKVRGSTDG